MHTLQYRLTIVLLTFAVILPARGQSERSIVFPDVTPYYTLKCDLHMHTVFSDGSVWPNIRVEEAHRDDLDAIAVTEHLEYQPHRHDIPHPDRNRAHEIAENANGAQDLIVINGSEVTRAMPPGHVNAIFLTDANRLVAPEGQEAIDPVEVFREAVRQDGFTFWNHPMWLSQKSDGMAALTDMHRMLISEGLLHGIEVVNQYTFSDEALQIALDHDLTILGTSDIHGLVDWDFEVPQGGHRPVTLVFAEERSADGIRAALRERRTVVWFKNSLIGRPQELVPLLEAIVQPARAEYLDNSTVLRVTFRNDSDATLLLRNRSAFGFHRDIDVITLAAHAETDVDVKSGTKVESLQLTFEVLNAITAPGTHPEIAVQIQVAE